MTSKQSGERFGQRVIEINVNKSTIKQKTALKKTGISTSNICSFCGVANISGDAYRHVSTA